MPEESTGIFDLVTGLPLHPLINHVVVVMVPLAVVTMVLVIIVPRLRRAFVPVGLVFSFLAAVSAFIAEKSGEALQSRVGSPGEHAELGENVVPVAIGFAVVALVWAVVVRAENPVVRWISRALAVIVVGLGAVLTTFTVLAGHSGAAATWEPRIAQEVSAPTETSGQVESTPAEPIAASVPESAPAVYTMELVAQNAGATRCWSVIDGVVYDFTTWIDSHPGGARDILNVCGIDGTDAFNSEHARDRKAQMTAEEYVLGALGDPLN
ncbi:MAG: cytochrome b5-like heme/steroid binding domain-containing protein [Pontimonas sp.]